MSIRPRSFAFMMLLGGLAMLAPLAIDLTLPAFAIIARDLGTTPAAVQLTLSLFLAGYALGQLAFGPLGDRYGRRPMLILGSWLFTAACFGQAVAPEIGVVLGGAAASGVGAAAGSTLARSAVRDVFEGHEALVRLSYIAVISNIAPVVAPAIGAGLLALANWRAIYALQGCAGLFLAIAIVVGFRETLPEGAAQPLRLAPVGRNALRFLRNPVTGGWCVTNACMFGALFAYISSAPAVFSGVFGVSAAEFAGLFALISFGIVCGALLTGRLAVHLPTRRLAASGLSIMAIGSVGTLVLGLAGAADLVRLMPLLFAVSFGSGVLFAVTIQGALQPVPDIAGLALGVFGAMQMLGASAASALAASLAEATGAPLVAMAGTMTLFVAAAVAGFVGLVVPGLRHAAASVEKPATP